MNNIVEGRNPVFESLKSGRPIEKIWLSKNIERHGKIAEILYLSRMGGIPVEYVDRRAIDRLSQTGSNQGVIAFTGIKDYLDLDDLLRAPENKTKQPFFVILDGVEDPHNLGAILRTGDAAGVDGVIIREKRAVGLTPAVEKASAGAAGYVPVSRVTNIARTIEILKQRNVWVVGIDREGKIPYTQIDFKPPTALVIGGEDKGISEMAKKNCDFVASIPMLGKILSLNASVAAGVVMYEVVRQRNLTQIFGPQ